MVSDAQARSAVRQLRRKLDLICIQHAGLAYVLAERDRAEYARLLDAADKAIPTVIQPVLDADAEHARVYAVLDDPSADWAAAVISMLDREPTTLSGD